MYFPCTGTINTRNPAPQAAAAILRRRSSCSALLSAPIVKASRTPSDNAYFRASSWRSLMSPCPKIFMPMTAFPAAFAHGGGRRPPLWSLDIFCALARLLISNYLKLCRELNRKLCRIGEGISMEWHEQPCARIMPFCLASDSTSITPLYRSVQSPSVRQCIRQMSM